MTATTLALLAISHIVAFVLGGYATLKWLGHVFS